MKKIKLLFCITDLSGGGAERVLLSLINALDVDKFDITLLLIYRRGAYLKSVPKHVKIEAFSRFAIPGLTRILSLLPRKTLFKLFIRGKYDLHISYLEYLPTKIIAGGNENLKKIAWVHSNISSHRPIYQSKFEMQSTYDRFQKIVFVSQTSCEALKKLIHIPDSKCAFLPNIVDTERIYTQTKDNNITLPTLESRETINFITVGKIAHTKGALRLARIMNRISANYQNWHLYYLGDGPDTEELKQYISINHLSENITILGFKDNPYKYISLMDVFISPSYSEGYSTATIESLILGLAVIVTDSGGMSEILKNGKYGKIVKNSDEALKVGIEEFLATPSLVRDYKIKAQMWRESFSPQKSITLHEKFFEHESNLL